MDEVVEVDTINPGPCISSPIQEENQQFGNDMDGVKENIEASNEACSKRW